MQSQIEEVSKVLEANGGSMDFGKLCSKVPHLRKKIITRCGKFKVVTFICVLRWAYSYTS
jgi:hypothetical protein